MIIRAIVMLIEILFCFLLQSSVFPMISLAGVVPDCLLILVICKSFSGGKVRGAVTGLLCGLICDLCYGEIIGLTSLIYLIVGYLAGFSNRIYDESDFTLPLVFTGAGELVYNCIYYILFFVLSGKQHFGFYLYRIIVPRMIYTILVSVILYRLFNYIEKHLPEKKLPKGARREVESND